MKKIIFLTIFILLAIFLFWTIFSKYSKPNNNIAINNIEVSDKDLNENDIEVVAENLEIPWEVVFLDETTVLITERPGNLKKVNLETKEAKIIYTFNEASHSGEGGLLGMTLHPNFEKNNYIYVYLTYKLGDGLRNKVERYELKNDNLLNKKIIIDGILGASNHDGGRISFGPDGHLYITTGDAQNESSAQQTTNLNGKILRVTDEGEIPEDNPFNNAIYSYGHRNSQGIAWDSSGNLWSTEHGPSGSQTGNDELNLIEIGKNYGWPIVKGTQKNSSMVSPIIESGNNDTWAPTQIIFYNEHLFFTGLKGETIYKARVENRSVINFQQYFKNEWGRLRTIVLGPDNNFYILTNNTDGRGSPKSSDDKLIRISPQIFF